MEQIIVKSKIKELAGNLNVAGEVAEKLNGIAIELVEKAGERATANGRKTIQSKDVYEGFVANDTMVVVKSKLKNVVSDLNCAGDLADALNSVLVTIIEQGCSRATANSRKTLQARDL